MKENKLAVVSGSRNSVRRGRVGELTTFVDDFTVVLVEMNSGMHTRLDGLGKNIVRMEESVERCHRLLDEFKAKMDRLEAGQAKLIADLDKMILSLDQSLA